MDRRDIVPGEDWEKSIWRAVRQADFLVFCLSKNAFEKRGFLQREIRQALLLWEEKLESDIFLIPARLDQCELPDSLSKFQRVDLFEVDGLSRLVSALHVGANRRGITSEDSADEASCIEPKLIDEVYSGDVPYEIKISYPEIRPLNTDGHREINQALTGFATTLLHEYRKLYRPSGIDREYLDELSEAARTSTLYVDYFVHRFDTHLLSIQFEASTYGAGAAHPNKHFYTKTYALDPVVELDLPDLFKIEESFLEFVSKWCAREIADQIRKDMVLYGNSEHYALDDADVAMIERGVAPNLENFRHFVLEDEVMMLIFQPYQVGPYAWGTRNVRIPYSALTDYVAPDSPVAGIIRHTDK